MLILTRCKDETVVMRLNGHRVVVVVREIQGRKVRIGVEASREVRIVRGELECAEGTCYRCLGSGVNKRGPKRDCSYCGGTGKDTSKEV